MTLPFFTIGHSNRSLEEFVGLLCERDVALVVDVRTVPRSRANPQFNRETLPAALEAAGVGYEHSAALGGLRGKRKGPATDVNAMWENQSFRNYADYALSDEFRAGLKRLVAQGRERRSAIMCAEAVWWRCHRRIIADYLIAQGETVFHIMTPGRLEPARLTEGAVVGEDSVVTYPLPAPLLAPLREDKTASRLTSPPEG